jgi:DNA-binding transcriptional regulator YiaG
VTALTRSLVREAQQRLGLSDAEIAARYGVADQTVRGWRVKPESRAHREPNAGLLAQMLTDAGVLDRLPE